ncbi:MAG: tetratricopeptide repeat protein [Candidatus Thiothrix putei]|uniref:Tetratricopeptide repeat protein n=1 Tax=Candidatus Thiothrix putei TaxID=3080811 RepID=A0AA95HEN4_9GAMM|nr:MAG: tetratricopeptide repeat protein [Candidatus Thiothrix putei]
MDDYRFEQAYRDYQNGRYPQAIDVLKELLTHDPNHAGYHGLLAASLLAQKRLYAAEYEIGIALQQEPHNPYLLLIKARITLFNNALTNAMACCDDALRINPELVDALLLKGDLYNLMDKREQQLSCIQQALALDPDSVKTLTAMGEYYHATGQMEQALATAQSALAASPENADANILMGNIQLARGNSEEASDHARFAILQNPESREALTLLSNIKARSNWFLGLWWRLNSKMSTLSNLQTGLVLIIAYLVFNLLSLILRDFGFVQVSRVVSFAWMALAIYSWVALPIYYKQLKKELEKFQFNRDY